MTMYTMEDATAELKSFCYDCRRLSVIADELKEVRAEIDSESMPSRGGLIRAQKDKSVVYRANDKEALFELLEREEALRVEFSQLRQKTRRISAVLASLRLTDAETRALCLRYENGRTYAFIGAVMYYDPCEVWRMLNSVLERFADAQRNRLRRSAPE